MAWDIIVLSVGRNDDLKLFFFFKACFTWYKAVVFNEQKT